MQFISKPATVIFVLIFSSALLEKYRQKKGINTFWYWFDRNFLSILRKWHILRIFWFGFTRKFRRLFSSCFLREFLEQAAFFYSLMMNATKRNFSFHLHVLAENFRKFIKWSQGCFSRYVLASSRYHIEKIFIHHTFLKNYYPSVPFKTWVKLSFWRVSMLRVDACAETNISDS